MLNMTAFFFLMICAYLIGSFSSAIIICKLFKLPDPRTQGSKNPGTTNMLRLSGKKFAVWVLLGDLLKGFLAVIFAKNFLSAQSAQFLGWIGLAVITGHIYPIFFHFKGGKGVATGAGVMLGLSLPLGAGVIAVWIIIAGIFRYSSLAAIIAVLSAPFFGYWLNADYLPALICIGFLILYRHCDNIRRLIRGTESTIGKLF